jgi:hypothetical protein
MQAAALTGTHLDMLKVSPLSPRRPLCAPPPSSLYRFIVFPVGCGWCTTWLPWTGAHTLVLGTGADAAGSAHGVSLLLWLLASLCATAAQIDVEGSEWGPVLQLFRDLSAGSMTVSQLQMELHSNTEVRAWSFCPSSL